MSWLYDLITELCPDGVSYEKLGDITEIRSGWGFPVVEQGRGEGEYPFFKVSDMNNPGNELEMRNANNYISSDAAARLGCKPAPAGTVIFPKIGAAIGTNKKRVLIQPSCYDNNVVGIISTKHILSRFIYYLFDSYDLMMFADYSGAMPSIRSSTLAACSVPLPPLPVQEQIVRMLDSFTALEAELEKELEAELEARTKQYETYRDALLAFDPENPHPLRPARLNHLIQTLCPDGVDFASLGEVSQYSKIRIPAFDVDSQTYVGVDNLLQNKLGKTVSDYVPTSGSLIGFGTGDILIGNIRPYLKKIWLSDIFGGTNGDVLVIQILDDTRETVSPKYLFYVLSSDNFFEYNVRYSKGAKMPRGDKQSIMNYQFYLPPLPVQEEIVAILDRFDALVNDLKIGLPAEIAARRKQYEYYRDQLLTFQPLE